MSQYFERSRRDMGPLARVDVVARLALAAVPLLGLVAGCATTGASRSGSDAPGVASLPSAVAGPAGDSQRMSVASASVQDISAILRSNDVDDPGHWSEIIVQNRPYPSNDPAQHKLQQVLARYRADPPTIARITNALTP